MREKLSPYSKYRIFSGSWIVRDGRVVVEWDRQMNQELLVVKSK